MFKISEAANLAIHALAFINSFPPETDASTATIATKLNCSRSHLAKVLNQLVHKGLLRSNRGARGGFRLAIDANEIAILRIVEIIDGPIPETGCMLGRQICDRQLCVFHNLFTDFREGMVTRLKEVRLVDIPIY